MFLTKEDEKRFWSKVEKTDTCWLWQDSLNTGGYGNFKLQGKSKSAHRIAYFLHTLRTPKCVLHSCDVRKCVNPQHLKAGTQLENIADMVMKNRQRNRPKKGEVNHFAKLTELEARAIKISYLDTKSLAQQFNISRRTVQQIKAGTRWSHV